MTHLNGIYEFPNRFVFMSPRFLEMLERILPRTYNQPLRNEQKQVIRNHNFKKLNECEYLIKLDELVTFESTSQMFLRVSSKGALVYTKD